MPINEGPVPPQSQEFSAGSRPIDESISDPGNIRDILRFLREENEANRKAVSQDSEANRKLFIDAAKIFSYPMTALIAVAVFFGYKDFSSLKSVLVASEQTRINSFVDQTRPVIFDHITKMVQEQVDKPEIQKTVRDEVMNSSTVNDAIRKQLQNELPEISKTVSDVVDKAMVDLRANVRASASTTPYMGRTADERITSKAGQPIIVTALFKNTGQENAVNVKAYCSIALVEQPDVRSERTKILTGLAKEVEKKLISKTPDAEIKGNVIFDKSFDLNFKGPMSSESIKRQIEAGTVYVYFVYFVEWENQEGNTYSRYFSGESSHDLKLIEHQNMSSTNWSNVLNSPSADQKQDSEGVLHLISSTNESNSPNGVKTPEQIYDELQKLRKQSATPSTLTPKE